MSAQRASIAAWFFAQRAKRDPGVRGFPRRILLASALFLLPAAGLPAAAAATPAPGWTIDSFAKPTNFSAADNARCLSSIQFEPPNCDAYQVSATDVGAQPTDGSAAVLTDTLPAGLTVQRIAFFWYGPGARAVGLQGIDLGGFLCNTTAVQCPLPTAAFGLPPIQPDDTLEMKVYVTVDDPNASGPLTNSAIVSGGGAPDASTSSDNSIGSATPPFGTTGFTNYIAGLDGAPDTQAGSHPYGLTTRIDLAAQFRVPSDKTSAADTSVQDVKDVAVDLPLGFLGSALATPTCSFAQLSSGIFAGVGGCPQETIVGHIRTEPDALDSVDATIYNMVPEHGVAAEFAYVDNLAGPHVFYASVVPSPAGYVLRTTAPDIPQISLTDIAVTFFGDPATKDSSGNPPVALFTNPADCSGQPLTSSIHMDSWQAPGTYNPDGSPNFADPNWASQTSESPPVSGCNKLQFAPTITAKPTTSQADSPSGLDVSLDLPQPTDPNTLATPPLKRAVVTLPEGITVNPSSANGLTGCSLGELGMSAAGVPDAAAPTCPDSSKLGTVALQTPLLAGTLGGSIYLAKPFENPFNSLLAIYIVVDDPTSGVIVKLAGEVKADPASGRLTTTVDNSPQFPFSELATHFFAGARAALRTPATCATYTTNSELTPWSAPESGPPATPSDSFQISSGGGGGSCANTPADQPNHPSFSAGTVTPIAAAFSPLAVNLRREDGSQQFSTVTLTPPPGLIGRLAGTPYCPQSALDAAAAKTGTQETANPSCPADSQIGTVDVAAGAGPAPYNTGGKVYLTGPYKGAPLSLAIITPATAGPFDLGTVVVRTALQIDPATTQITATSDPIPTILDGIPLDLRSAQIKLDKPNFTLNGTSCNPLAFSGSLLSTLGQAAPLSERFQLGECGRLGFKPSLKLHLKGGTKRNGHPAFTSVLSYPQGTYANLAKAQVTLPPTMQLDQSHIQAPCTRPQFAANQCPESSLIGQATATSPLLDYQLAGPVYLLTNGHALPDVMLDLKGPASQPIEIHVDGIVDTVHARLRTTFATVPDAPVSRAVISLAGAGKGLLVNNTNLCAQKDIATILLDGQNGKTADSNPAVNVAGCRKAHKHHKRHHRRHGAR